jgi:ubiquinone/menaquinone biosynthesis C-methylase UbiE
MTVDFGKTADDYGRYRAGFPGELFDRLSTRGIFRRGSAVLDLGTGTGTLARGFALRGCDAVGLDPSAELLAEAGRLDEQSGVSIRYVQARAEDLPFGDSIFDVVSAGQCWHWFDRLRSASETHRVLKSAGSIVIAHFDWIPMAGNVVDATEQLIMRHNPRWHMAGGNGVHAGELADVAQAGFSNIESFSFDAGTSYTHDAWRGRIRASAGVSASLTPEEVARFDADLAALLACKFPQDPLIVPHRVWAVIAQK